MENALRIVIIGFRGTGKSTLGNALAKKLKRPFIDTDTLIKAHAKANIPEIFAKEGEAGFRKREKEVIRSITSLDAVIACGGGAILDPDNAEVLLQNCYCIFLTASLKTIWARIQHDPNRPALTKLPPFKEIRKLLKVRTPIYAKYADIQFSTENRMIKNLLEEVIEHLKREVI